MIYLSLDGNLYCSFIWQKQAESEIPKKKKKERKRAKNDGNDSGVEVYFREEENEEEKPDAAKVSSC